METEKIIKDCATRLHYTEDRMYNLYYTSGLNYIAALKASIVHLPILKAQFSVVLSNGSLKITPEETFNHIERSPLFWAWWVQVVWGCCTITPFNGIEYTGLIPSNVIINLFDNDTKEISSSRRTPNVRRHANTVGTAHTTAR